MTQHLEDPLVRDLIARFRALRLSRRGLLRGATLGAAGAGALALSACAPRGGTAPAAGDGSGGSLVWGNWTSYLDYDASTQRYPSLDGFMAGSNIDVDYVEDIDDNNTFYGKIKDQLALGQDIGYDTICLTDWMCARLITAGQVRAFDHARIPNLKHLTPSLLTSLDVDPGRQRSIPWQGVMAGLAWNTAAVPGGIASLDDLLAPELAGKVGVLSEMRDTMGIIMMHQGVAIGEDWGDAEFDRALEWLDDGLRSKQIARVKGNSYVQDLEKDDTLAALCWSGDIAVLNAEAGERWSFEIPESGGTTSADSFLLPAGSAKGEEVAALIDYYYQPEVAAVVADYVWFMTPVAGAREAMERVNPEQVDNPYIFPDEAMTARLQGFRSLAPDEDQRYSAAFARVMGN